MCDTSRIRVFVNAALLRTGLQVKALAAVLVQKVFSDIIVSAGSVTFRSEPHHGSSSEGYHQQHRCLQYKVCKVFLRKNVIEIIVILQILRYCSTTASILWFIDGVYRNATSCVLLSVQSTCAIRVVKSRKLLIKRQNG